MSNHFDPHSQDSMFSRILLRLDHQDRMLLDILAEAKKTNGRVSRLEQIVAILRAQKALVVSIVVAAASVIAWATKVILALKS